MVMSTSLVFLLLFVLSIAGCSGTTPVVHSTTPTGPEVEEYAVYATVINELYVAEQTKLVIIKDRTGLSHSISKDLNRELELAQRDMTATSNDTIKDFQEKNQQSYPLDDSIRTKTKCLLIGEKEVEEIYQDVDGWSNFYKKYPDSQGIMTLSRVGFNKDLNQALVYVGNRKGGLSGMGLFILLSKGNGNWIIQDKYSAWVS